jgi:pyrroloquinoline quinone (PQQ) biosynthesis protein C/quercetin dioxygenase-like cupin family protein
MNSQLPSTSAISQPARKNETLDARPTAPSPETALRALLRTCDEHPFWSCELLRACSAGSLTREDFKFIFSQYYSYSRNFTRYISASMANCDDDYFRSRLTENLWEESGQKDIEQRHPQIFRRFLREGLGIDVDRIEFIDSTRYFVRAVLDFCLHEPTMASSAFLSVGTEGIVARLYRILVDGLARAGVEDRHLEFFHLHIACDDQHAETLERMMCSYAAEPGWFDTCARAINHALTLRQNFFDSLMDALPQERVRPLIRSVSARATPRPGPHLHRGGAPGSPLYANTDEARSLEFYVERLPFTAEVLDPRVVRIPPGKSNELHRHAHETLIFVVAGRCCVEVDEQRIDVNARDTVFVPRWALHRTTNTGPQELCYLAVTDFGFASKVQLGDYLEGHRQRRESDRSFPQREQRDRPAE